MGNLILILHKLRGGGGAWKSKLQFYLVEFLKWTPYFHFTKRKYIVKEDSNAIDFLFMRMDEASDRRK